MGSVVVHGERCLRHGAGTGGAERVGGARRHRPGLPARMKYLLSTQLTDGSWHVRSRAIAFQPYFESGFPHGHDQWISAAATNWATMALIPAAR